MPEEIEIPTEHLHEHMQEAVEHEGGSFNTMVALSSAILAVLAAVCGLMAGHHANEAMMEQIQSSDQWAFYQAKGIKAAVLDTKIETLLALNKKASAADKEKVEGYKKDQEGIKDAATEKAKSAEEHLARHVVLAKAVTLFQVAIALGAMAVMTRRKLLWYASLILGLAGSCFFVMGLI